MITIFTIPKPFKGESIHIQTNAIKSWRSVIPGSQIILWGDDEGVKEYASVLNVEWGGPVPRNKFNTPLISEVFNMMKCVSRYEFLLYINADIIIINNLNDILDNHYGLLDRKIIICGRRTDCEIKGSLDFDREWIKEIIENSLPLGIKHGYSGIDYILYPASLDVNLKPFPVGRPGWDNWLLFYCKKNGILVMDASEIITAIHQNHKPAYSYKDRETKENRAMLNGFLEVANIYHADYILKKAGYKKPGFIRRVISFLSVTEPFYYLFAIRRLIINWLN